MRIKKYTRRSITRTIEIGIISFGFMAVIGAVFAGCSLAREPRPEELNAETIHKVETIKEIEPEIVPEEIEVFGETEEFKEEPEDRIYTFRGGNGTPLDVQSMTDAWAAEAGMTKRYDLTDEERWEVASVVMAEAGAEPYAGMVAVAQCILQACEDDNIRPTEAFIEYKYTKRRPEPSEDALKAVQAVFDFGHVVTNEPIKYFYAKALVKSDWHESQDFVIEINCHRFFAEKD